MSYRSAAKDFSYKKWCATFCCPPLPTSIISKLAFKPLTIKTYELIPTESGSMQYVFQLSPDIDQTSLKRLLQQDARFVKTLRGNNVVVLFIKCTKTKNFTILYSHGGSVDVGYMHRLCTDLSLMTGCDIVTYDYSGYGESTGTPSEMNMYADIRAAWDYTITFQEPNPLKIVLYGQGIGTVATIDLASKVQCAGVIVQSPLMSARRLFIPRGNLLKFLHHMNR
nr:alpha/beta hydrolase domain-containing protein 17C-like [Parasteatoda tepidariorum]